MTTYEPQHVERDRRVGLTKTLRARQRSCGSQTCCVRQKICFERRTAFSLPLLLKKGGEGRGEEAFFINFPSLRLSLPARNERGESGKTPQAFCVPNTTGHRPALLWLRLRRAWLYRRLEIGRALEVFRCPSRDGILRYSGLQVRATGSASRLNEYPIRWERAGVRVIASQSPKLLLNAS